MNWPFENDTSAIVKKLAKRSLQRERRRNMFAVIALALTSFMITAVFSIGFSYFETYQMQQIRFMGTTADVAITNPTEGQLAELAKSSLVLDVGIQQRLGSVDAEQMQGARLGVVWLDGPEWENHRLPAISEVVGDYPVREKEVMLPTWALEQMGISNPQAGMEIMLSYQIGDNYDFISDTFLLSGYYTDYISARTDNRGYVYVSAAFRDGINISSLNDSVSAMVRFRDNDDVGKACEELQHRIGFTEKQAFEIVPFGQANGGSFVFAVIWLAVFISFSGYLLIYNILYLSVVKDVQFYGRFKTIGMTKRQIKGMIKRQAVKISCVGIPVGLVLGVGVSFGVVPYALDMLYSSNSGVGTKVSFSPFIFIGAAVFTFMTAMAASMEPAKIAGSVSPMAALRYAEVSAKAVAKVGAKAAIKASAKASTEAATKASAKTSTEAAIKASAKTSTEAATKASTKMSIRNRHRIKLSRMAWNNVFRNVKSAFFVFASLFCGLSLFLAVTGILHSLSPENFVDQWGGSDFAVTYSIHESEDLISGEMVSEIGRMDGIGNLRLTYAASAQIKRNVSYDDAVFHEFLMSLDGKSGIDFSDPAELEAYQQNFYSGVYGIDSAYLEEINETLSVPVDMADFERGNLVLLSKMADSGGNDLIGPGQEITIETPNGWHSFTVANGFLDADFQAGRGIGRGTAPNLYISQAALQELFPQYRVFRVAFDADGRQEGDILQELKQITASRSGIDIMSRYEKREEIRDYLVTAKVLGTGLSVILMLVGVMNFVNTMVVSVSARRHELAVLESVGMTKRQTRRMLSVEGCCYWGVSFSLVATVGTVIYMLLYLAFSKLAPYAVFSYPWIPLAMMAGVTLLICFAVPVWAYKVDLKASVVERLWLTD